MKKITCRKENEIVKIPIIECAKAAWLVLSTQVHLSCDRIIINAIIDTIGTLIINGLWIKNQNCTFINLTFGNIYL